MQLTHRWYAAARKTLGAVASALVMMVATVVLAVPAQAADPVPLGGGSGIVVNGDTFCTLTAIGNDDRGNLIGFTSAHCGGPGAQVSAEAAEDRGVLGTMVAGNDGLDYAVIQFDRALVAPVDNVDGFQIDGIGPDPSFGEVACKLGRTTGYSCGVTWGPGKEPGTIVNQVCGQPGDSGAPVTVNNRLVGMIHGAFSQELPTCVVKYVPLHTPAVTMSINAVLADITAKNRPGSGFVPVGSSPAA
ncbi:serine protease [Mycolicibacterium grossiae]|nr:S1 family peptidase [Mycolicibacterium grossiae]QEM43969.1 serine protease [Mycolicibacterium grossiae]